MDLRGAIIEMGRKLSEENDSAFNLWTWLPSYAAAKKAHGDYASEHTPSIGDVMKEAATFIAHGLKPTPEQITEAGDWYKCPCGESHETEDPKPEEPK